MGTLQGHTWTSPVSRLVSTPIRSPLCQQQVPKRSPEATPSYYNHRFKKQSSLKKSQNSAVKQQEGNRLQGEEKGSPHEAAHRPQHKCLCLTNDQSSVFDRHET